MNKIELHHVTKTYGNQTVLNDVTATIQGSFGLLGPNGAGKTTLMRVLTNLVRQDEGDILLEGKSTHSHIGYLPQHFTLYRNVTVFECLHHLAILKGSTKDKVKQEIEIILSEVNLTEQRNQKIKKLSGGMLRRVGIAQAMLNSPDFLIVDEPTVGLDIEERARFRTLLRKLGKNRTILISTHLVEDVEMTCDYIGILQKGKLIFTGTKQQLKSLAEGKIREKLMTLEEADNKENLIISVTPQHDVYLVRYFSEEGEGTAVAPTIEDAYLYLTGSGKHK